MGILALPGISSHVTKKGETYDDCFVTSDNLRYDLKSTITEAGPWVLDEEDGDYWVRLGPPNLVEWSE